MIACCIKNRWLHSVAVSTLALQVESLGFNSQRNHIVGACKGQPVAADLLLTQELDIKIIIINISCFVLNVC